MGAINSPHNIYLLERGLKTFELRMQRHNAERPGGRRVSGRAIRGSRRCIIPGLASHPVSRSGPAADARLRRPGHVPGERRRLASRRPPSSMRVQIPRIAPSLGGVESLIEQPLVMSYYECTPEDRRRFGIPDNMIRLSCGIENTEDLIADLRQALKTSWQVQTASLMNFEIEFSMQFRTRAIHVGHERDPANRRRRAADSLGLHVRAARGGRVGRVRLFAQRQSDAEGVRDDDWPTLEGGIGGAGVRLRHGGDALRDDAACERRSRARRSGYLRRHVSAAAQGAQPRRRDGVAGRPARDLAAFEAAITPQTKLLWIESARQSADVDHRHRGRRRASPSAAACCWASTTRSPRPC